MKIRWRPCLAASLLFLAACRSGGDAKPVSNIWNLYSGDRAFADVKALVDIGPRPSGSKAVVQARQYIVDELQKAGWTTELQQFDDDTPRGRVTFCNIIARFGNDKTTQQAIVCSHYDTKIFDTIRFVGASDGGSSTGALIELARTLAQDPGLARRVELVFFDGEEAFQTWSASDSTYGSRHLAARWGRDGTLSKIKAFMLADMIGDKDLDIQRESRSTGWLVDLVRQSAHKYGYDRYFFQTEEAVDDDHLAFVQRGVPSIDVIDLDYGPNNAYHHTAQDTMDKISARSLTIDGDVFMETIRLIDLR